jgi:hypothetical protein
MRKIAAFVTAGVAGSLLFLTPSIGHAQIIGQVDADIHHKFIVGNATLPPGHYVFRMTQGTGQSVMTVTKSDGEAGAEFLVRSSVDSKTPQHTVIVFDRYGNHEVLEHIYQVGDKDGVTVIEPSREQARLEKQGQTPFEHSEEQKP